MKTSKTISVKKPATRPAGDPMKDRDSRILTTHVGSLIRPPEIVAYAKKMFAGEAFDEAEYQRTLKRAVADVVKHQTSIGIDIVSDGEYGKSHWFRYLNQRITGLEARVQPGKKLTFFAGRDRERFPEFYATYDKTMDTGTPVVDWAVVGDIAYKGEDVLERDIEDLKAAMSETKAAAGFLPVVAPASVLPEFIDEHYNDMEKCAFAIGEALRVEYKTISEAGLIVQIDDAWMPAMYDRMVPPGKPADWRRWAEICIKALNHALRGIPEERTRYHICWGSWVGPHTADLPLKDFIDLLLTVKCGGYSFEAANPTHEHEWKVWKDVKLPEGRYILPGVVTHRTTAMEDPEVVADRIIRYAEIVGRENVIASTDCGFAQGALYQRVHPSIQWAKLERLVQGAELASKQLWKR